MQTAYENALRTVADAYEGAVAMRGGKSLARVATIVVNNGAFFTRLRAGKPFYVTNLERFAAWFRIADNWPEGEIPHDAATALRSIGRDPDVFIPHTCGTEPTGVAFDPATIPNGGAA